jgi:uncharacterized protein YjaG (DUF416 family)
MILPCSSSELNVEVCLLNGQSFRFMILVKFVFTPNFRFTKTESNGEFPIIRGVALNRVWQFQRVDDKRVSYQVLARFGSAVESDDEAVLQGYFQVIAVCFKFYGFIFSSMLIC